MLRVDIPAPPFPVVVRQQMPNRTEKSNSNRREFLKGIGVGGLVVPTMTGLTEANTEENTIGRINVTNVEIGQKQWGGGWESYGNQIDSDTGIDVKVNVSGLSGDSHFVSMVVAGGPNGELDIPNTMRRTDMPGGSASYIHGNEVGNIFKLDSIFTPESEGTWRFYVSAFENDGSQNAHGVGTSGDIRIR